MTDVYSNLSNIISGCTQSVLNAPDTAAEVVSSATGVDKTTLLIGAGTVLAVGAATAVLFKYGPKLPSQAELKALLPEFRRYNNFMETVTDPIETISASSNIVTAESKTEAKLSSSSSTSSTEEFNSSDENNPNTSPDANGANSEEGSIGERVKTKGRQPK